MSPDNTDANYLSLPLIADMSTLAYVRPVNEGFAVCASDGTQLAVFNTRDAAYYAARQHDLEPVYLH